MNLPSQYDHRPLAHSTLECLREDYLANVDRAELEALLTTLPTMDLIALLAAATHSPRSFYATKWRGASDAQLRCWSISSLVGNLTYYTD
jgi:hypothetical protein